MLWSHDSIGSGNNQPEDREHPLATAQRSLLCIGGTSIRASGERVRDDRHVLWPDMSSDIQIGGAVRGDSVEYIRYADSSKPGKAPLSFRGRVAIRFDRQEIANEWGSRDKFRLSASRERPRSMKARRRIERSNRQKSRATRDIASMPPLSLSNRSVPHDSSRPDSRIARRAIDHSPRTRRRSVGALRQSALAA